MTRSTTLLVLVLTTLSTLMEAESQWQCAEDEVFIHGCGERPCFPSCEGDPENCQCPDPSEFIPPLCYSYCTCEVAYIKDRPGGKCVPIEECPKVVQCPENEEFSESKSNCEPSCQNRKPQSSTQGVGCVCIKGYIREGPGGRCVPESCKNVTICKKNEKWSTCVACPRYCNEINPTCLAYCQTGCECKPGYIRRRVDGACIPLSKCPCKKNEIYTECGSACPATCSQPDRPCMTMCVEGCFCKDGYLLDENTKECIAKSECPKVES